MKVIGLCGGSGAGKTTVSEALKLCGAGVIDTDRVYRELCVSGSDCLRELSSVFGDSILLSYGGLDRKKLASIVYEDKDKREVLNNITHRYIKEETVKRINEYADANMPAVVVDAPLLFESGFDLLCDTTVGVVADEEIRIKRITSRDTITAEHAKARIRAQYSDAYLRDRCEYILENNGELCELVKAAAELYGKIILGK